MPNFGAGGLNDTIRIDTPSQMLLSLPPASVASKRIAG
jgi:hypothetical protein